LVFVLRLSRSFRPSLPMLLKQAIQKGLFGGRWVSFVIDAIVGQNVGQNVQGCQDMFSVVRFTREKRDSAGAWNDRNGRSTRLQTLKCLDNSFFVVAGCLWQHQTRAVDNFGEHRRPVRQSDGLVPWRACSFSAACRKALREFVLPRRATRFLLSASCAIV
jgi:hypothetical protein